MSVVAAKISDNKITMSADSIILSGWQRKDQEHFKAAKMCKTNGMLIGSCGSLQESSMFQVFCANHKPESPKLKSVLEFMIDFKKWMKDLSLDPDVASDKKPVENQYLIAFDSSLWVVYGWDVIEIKDCYAIGAGEDYALAALHLGCSPREAVKVACEISCYVCDPVLEETIEINH